MRLSPMVGPGEEKSLARYASWADLARPQSYRFVGVPGIADLHTRRRTDDDRPVGRRMEGIPGFGIDRVA